MLDTPPDERFDRITRIAARVYGADVAFLSFVDADQQWMKSKTSDALSDHIERDRSICTMVVASGAEMVIEDMRQDPMLEGHPVARDIPWRFYAGVPLRGEEGSVIGTLCILREEPGAPPAFNIDVLRDLADISSHELTLARRNTELHQLSNTDALTGLPNRRMFDQEFHRSWRRARRTGVSTSLLLLDLDHFKEVNDTAGHQAGDQVLAKFGRFLSSFAARPDDLAARVGGEEFALILAGSDEPGAAKVADAIIRALDAIALPHPLRKVITTSIGCATLRSDEDHVNWWTRADRALYAAKAGGRAQAQSL
ncbi:diguanylate cyclase (GGDEF) domain-containing protein [Kaistia soli DSM 19436]|uniref:diguanylate cyclase n=1 Tax=Kaistia soli DSM 19436 TaxID=1122133 RepID=A0A1M4Y4L2_9HYPH|nr:sensor domain-containing diguanylate cyclase [Kaistia soli]SHF00635.1 diguanylate cyclase (GGDEF) domain-containing protein [Kaistia soli DSM 19436]